MSSVEYDELKWIFTDRDEDLRGNVLANLMLSANSADVEKYINAKNYGDKKGCYDDTVHPDFVQLIVDAALHARNIDSLISSVDGYVTLSDHTAKKIYDKIYGNWGNLSQSAKTFYDNYIKLLKNVNNKWDHITLINADVQNDVRNNLNIYRLNFSRPNPGSDTTKLALMLPRLRANKAVCYHTTNGGIDTISNVLPDFLTKIYDGIFENHQNFNVKISAGKVFNSRNLKTNKSSDIMLNLLVNDLIRSTLTSVRYAIPSNQPQVVPDDAIFLSASNENIWVEAADGSYHRTVNGETTKWGRNDNGITDHVFYGTNCVGTELKGDSAKCKSFVHECILGGDQVVLGECLKKLNTGSKFFNIATNDIKNLHPVLAYRMLSKFGFKKFTTYDNTAGTQILKIESVDHWKKRYLSTVFDHNDMYGIENSTGQRNLLRYLDLVVQYVNANPGILNKNYGGQSNESVGVFTSSPFALSLGIGIRRDPRKESSTLESMMRLRSQTSTSPLGNFFTTTPNYFSTPFGTGVTPGVPFIQGGGNGRCEFASNGTSSGKLIAVFMASIVNELKQKGKEINKNDMVNLNKNLQKLEELETEMTRTLCYIDEYSKLIDILKDYKGETLNLSYIKQFNDRFNKILGKKQGVELHFIDIFSRLLREVENDDANYTPL